MCTIEKFTIFSIFSIFNNRRDQFGRIKPAKCPNCSTLIKQETQLFPSRDFQINKISKIVDDLPKSLNGLNKLVFYPINGNDFNETVESLMTSFREAIEDENKKKVVLDVFKNLATNINHLSHLNVLDKSHQEVESEIRTKVIELEAWKREANRMSSIISKLKNKNKKLIKPIKRMKFKM